MKLTFLQQDIVEYLIFHGAPRTKDIENELDAYVLDELEALKSQGLLCEHLSNMNSPQFSRWSYCGGPVSEFFLYTQTKGMSDGIQS